MSGQSVRPESNRDEFDPEHEQDFDKAYNKLLQKYYGEQGVGELIPEEDLYRL